MPYQDTVGTVARMTIAVLAPQSQMQECNISYAVTAVTGAQDSRNDLLAHYQVSWSTFFASWLNQTYEFYGMKVAILYPKPAPLPETSVVGSFGILTGGPMPSQARPLISFYSALAGRKYRGRIYLPTPDYTLHDAAANKPNAASAVKVATLLGSVLTAYTSVTGGASTTWTPCIAHRPTPPATLWTYDPITFGEYKQEYATQRRSGMTGRMNTPPW